MKGKFYESLSFEKKFDKSNDDKTFFSSKIIPFKFNLVAKLLTTCENGERERERERERDRYREKESKRERKGNGREKEIMAERKR